MVASSSRERVTFSLFRETKSSVCKYTRTWPIYALIGIVAHLSRQSGLDSITWFFPSAMSSESGLNQCIDGQLTPLLFSFGSFLLNVTMQDESCLPVFVHTRTPL